MDPATELTNLQTRHQQLLREHAILEAREAERASRREELRETLRKAGVNPDQPKEELARLREEIRAILDENQAALDDFEAQLKATRAGQASPLPTETVNPPANEATEPTPPTIQQTAPSSSDIEIE
jgi:peptidoglycan hydrolase CwlO-like protein